MPRLSKAAQDEIVGDLAMAMDGPNLTEDEFDALTPIIRWKYGTTSGSSLITRSEPSIGTLIGSIHRTASERPRLALLGLSAPLLD